MDEFLKEFKDNEFFDVLVRSFLNQCKMKYGNKSNEFGLESAKVVVASMLIKGFYELPED